MYKSKLLSLGIVLLASLVVTGAVFLISGLIPQTADATGAENCADPSLWLVGTITSKGPGTAYAKIENRSTSCTYTVGFASYKVYQQGDPLESQTIFDSKTYTIKPGEIIGPTRLQVAVPSCRYQLDLFQGNPLQPPYYGGKTSGHWLMDYAFGNTQLCSKPSPTPTPTPSKTPTPTPTPSRTPTPTPGKCALTITKTVDSVSTTQNNVLKYTINFKNTGTAACTGSGVKVQDQLSNQLSYLSETHSSNVVSGYERNPVAYDPATHTVTWNARILREGESGWVSARVKVKDLERCDAFDIANTGRITAKEYDWRWIHSNTVHTKVSASCPTPTPSRTPTPTPSHTPTPTPSHTPTPTPTHTPTPTPSHTPTPTPSPTPVALTCNPLSTTLRTFETATLSASGGTGSYFWNAPDGNPSSGTNSTFFVSYSTPGSRTVSVQSGSQTAVCFVNVIENTPTPTPTIQSLSVQKLVRNLSTGTGELDSVNANPNDSLEFVIRVTANGNSTINNVRAFDSLPSNLSYNQNSTTVDGSSQSDGIVSGGIFLNSMFAGQTKTIRFRATVSGESFFVSGTTTLTNVVNITADNSNSVSDSATVIVTKSNTVINQFLGLDIQKFGRNVTRGETAELTSVSVFPNDTVEFILRVRSTSNVTITNVIVSDQLPAGLTYIANTTSLNNSIVADGIVSVGINIGSLSPNQTAIVKFSAKVGSASVFPSGANSVTNIALVRADNVPTSSAQLPIILGQVLGTSTVKKVSGVATGPVDSIMLAVFLSLLVTYGYMYYTTTPTFANREANASLKRIAGDNERLNFARLIK